MQEMKIFHNLDLQKRLINEFGLSLRQAQKTINTYPIPYINESLGIIKHKIHQKLIKNIPAYTLTVLKNDFYPTLTDKQKLSILPSIKGDEREKCTNRDGLENFKSTDGGALLHHTDNSSVSKAQTKALKDFYSLQEDKQKQIVKKFEDEKIRSDILKTLYKRE